MTDEDPKKVASRILDCYADPIPEGLIESLRSGSCVLLAGAGVTRRCLSRARCLLPSWTELLRAMVSWAFKRKAFGEDVRDDLHDLLARGEHLVAAEELIDRLGPSGARHFLAEVFDPEAIVPSHLHELLVVTPFRWIVTTNYDNLFERAFSEVNRQHIGQVRVDDLVADPLALRDGQAILKLHGDLDHPESIILGQKHYQKLLGSETYMATLERVFSGSSVLMVGYGMRDPDILLALDRVAGKGHAPHPHFLLCPRGSRSEIEKNRLAADRNVHLIEYVDHFGFHNHADTFFIALNHAINNGDGLRRVRPPIRCRVQVHYRTSLEQDGLFVWNFLFREGAITMCDEAQSDQHERLERSIAEGMKAVDYILFVVTDACLSTGNAYLDTIQKCLAAAEPTSVQVLFLVVGTKTRPQFLQNSVSNPCFYVEGRFSEQDLMLLRSYIAQDVRMGLRQP